jgi:hypothetical protein
LKSVREALRFIRLHGIVLEAGAGHVPSLAEAISGRSGAWWSHPQARLIFKLTRGVRDSADVLVCRLVGGKITYVHRRLWPALARLSGRFKKKDLAALREEHTASGRHRLVTVPYPDWLPPGLSEVSEEKARRELGPVVPAFASRDSTQGVTKAPRAAFAR